MGLNTGTPLSELALRDLRYALEHGDKIDEVVMFLCWDENEVREKMVELGIRQKAK